MKNILNINRIIVLLAITSVGSLATIGCGDKSDSAATAPGSITPANTAPASAPTTVAAESEGKQQMGQQIGNDAAANAAAYNAAKAKAEAGGK